MSFRVTGLPLDPFRHLIGASDAVLAEHRAVRLITTAESDFADRIELRKPEPGETVLLVNFLHQPADSPYRARHAVHVAERSTTPFQAIDTIPDVMRGTVLALRGFDTADMLVGRTLAEDEAVHSAIDGLLADPAVAYVHAHYAGAGCYAARMDRA